MLAYQRKDADHNKFSKNGKNNQNQRAIYYRSKIKLI